MSAVSELTHALIASGMDVAEAAALVARAGAEMCSVTPSKAAARTRRWRAKKASQTVTERHAVTPPSSGPEPSPSVTNRHQTVTGDAAHISPSLEVSKDLIKEEEEKIEGPRTKRPSRIPDDWNLERRHIDYAISKGIAAARIPILGEKFKTHFLAASGKGSVSPNWFLKWCTWCMNEIEWNGASNGKRQFSEARSLTAVSRRAADDAARAAGMADDSGEPILRVVS